MKGFIACESEGKEVAMSCHVFPFFSFLLLYLRFQIEERREGGNEGRKKSERGKCV